VLGFGRQDSGGDIQIRFALDEGSGTQIGTDSHTPSGRFMFQIIAAFGELERAIIAERVKAGLQNAKRRGKRLGRPQVAVDAPSFAKRSVTT
jgi:DNA invertase Pin-like site-specific DNA recombinase